MFHVLCNAKTALIEDDLYYDFKSAYPGSHPGTLTYWTDVFDVFAHSAVEPKSKYGYSRLRK